MTAVALNEIPQLSSLVAYNGVHCPGCGKYVANMMTGWHKSEIYVKYGCPECGIEAVGKEYSISSSDGKGNFMHFGSEGQKAQRKFYQDVSQKLIGYRKQSVIEN